MWAPPVVAATSLSTLIQGGGSALYVLFFLYLASFLYALRRGCLLPRARFGVQRLFVAAVTASCGVRALSFALCTLLALDLAPSSSSGWLSDSRLLLVLFNTGDWVAIVTYALLLLVWLETLLRTRVTVYSPARIQRDWEKVIWALAVLLQLAQVGLYAAVFSAGAADAPTARALTDAIFATVAAFNVALPALAAIGGLLELAFFAGFPFRSPVQKSAWRRVSAVVAAWTVGRVVWAVCSLLLVDEAAPAAMERVGPWLFPMLMVTVFVSAELLPFLACLGTEQLRAFTLGARGEGVRGRGRSQSQRALSGEELGLEESLEEGGAQAPTAAGARQPLLDRLGGESGINSSGFLTKLDEEGEGEGEEDEEGDGLSAEQPPLGGAVR